MYSQLIALTYVLVNDGDGKIKCEGQSVQYRIWLLQHKMYAKDVKINNVRKQR